MSAVVHDLFASDDGASLEQQHVSLPPVERALAAIEAVLKDGWAVLLAFSSGKDSSTCANLLLMAALNVIRNGFECPPIVISHADTTVENPVVRALADGELAKIERFAREHGIPLDVRIGRPTLAACFTTRVVGGRALPPFPSLGRRDCAQDWKCAVGARIQREFVSEQGRGAGRRVVTMTGVRSDESAARAQKTAARRETAHCVWFNDDGEARLSPILDWTTDEVWEFIGECAAGLHPSYSDFSEVMEFYRSAGNSSCVIVADMKSIASSKPCGGRSGCWTCTATAQDRSVQNMLEESPSKYGYLAPLMQFRDYLVDTQHDWRRRNFLGRTISRDGTMRVMADQYSPAECERLLRYLLAAQDRANALGAPAPVRAIGIRELVGVDWYWSLRAWHPPFHALWVYLDHLSGNRQYAPKISIRYAPSPAPVIGDIHVGGSWDEEWSDLFPAGLRYPAWEMFSDSCGPSLRSSEAGKVFLDLDETPEFDVDEEAAEDFMSFIAEDKIAEMHRADYPDWTAGAMTYLQYGTVTLASGSSSMVDNMMRRSQWLQQHGLHGHQSAEALRSRCVRAEAHQVDLFA